MSVTRPQLFDSALTRHPALHNGQLLGRELEAFIPLPLSLLLRFWTGSSSILQTTAPGPQDEVPASIFSHSNFGHMFEV